MTEASSAKLACKLKLLRLGARVHAFGHGRVPKRLTGGWLRLASQAAVLSMAGAYYGASLGRREVSLLESQDLGIASDLFRTYALSPDHSPLHFVLLDLWQTLNSSSVAFLRLPSVIFCAIAALVIFCLADAIAGRIAGVLAAAFMIFNADVVDVARSMRLYSLVIVGSALCLWFAHSYLARGRQRRHLLGFAVSATIAVYTHLFAWLLVAPLGALFGLDIGRTWGSPAARLASKYGLVTLVVLLPQVAHGLFTIGFARERHVLYQGMSSDAVAFLTTTARTLFLGESEATVPVGNAVLLVPAALLSLGLISVRRRGAIVVLVVVAPALGVAWFLSRSSQIEARYLCFLAPISALVMGIGAARVPKAHLFAPLSLTALWLSNFATNVAYDVTPTDWHEAAVELEGITGPNDVVAVFPGYWATTFRRYSTAKELVPITFPVDLERVLARGKRVLLVRNSGRYFGNLEAELSNRTRYAELFETSVRDPLVVYSVVRRAGAILAVPHAPDSLLVAGTFGSGGYPWQGVRDANPFDKLSPLLSGSAFAIIAYEPYHPPWYAPLLLGESTSEQLQPNGDVIYQLTRARISAAVLACGERRCDADADLLTANGITVVARYTARDQAKATLFRVGDVSLGVLGFAPGAPLGGADQGAFEVSIRRARLLVGPTGRLIGLVPSMQDYGRMATDDERVVAHRLIDLGVDVVIGQGGYAAKEIEDYGGGIIAYSLGTLLRPPMLSLAQRESTGLLLRLSFPIDGKAKYESFPVTSDDHSVTALDDPKKSARLLVHGLEAVGTSLTERLNSARATVQSDSGEHDMGELHADGSCLQPVERTFFARTNEVTRWFPETPPSTPLRPSVGALCGDGAYVARRGILSLGEYRRAIELEPGGNTSVRVRFTNVRLGQKLRLTFGIPDDRLLSKYRPFREQTVAVDIGNQRLFMESMSYRAGWHAAWIGTSSFAQTVQDVVVSSETSGTHFPIAFDLEIPGNTQ